MWTCPNNVAACDEEDGLSNLIGSQCKSFADGDRNVVLVFGGVGTHKGDLTDVMVSEYNFYVICMEEMVGLCTARARVCVCSCVVGERACFHVAGGRVYMNMISMLPKVLRAC
jgi:hypothetical protein